MDYQKIAFESFREIVVIARGEVIVFVSPSVRMAGYDVSEVVGRKFYEFISDEDRGSISEILNSLREDSEVTKRLLVKRKDGKKMWLEATCKKVNDHIVAVARDVSRLVSCETLLKGSLDLMSFVPDDVEELERALRKYFPDAKFLEEVKEFNLKENEVTLPVKFQGKELGGFWIHLPDWFELDVDDLRLFDFLGSILARNMLMIESRKVMRSSLIAIKAASENFATLVDRIRNPLAAINGLVEVKVGGEVYEKVHEQVKAISEIVKILDVEWIKIDKIADELIKTFNLLETLPDNPD